MHTQYSFVSLLLSFDEVEIIFFFLGLDKAASRSSSRLRLWLEGGEVTMEDCVASEATCTLMAVAAA